MAHPIRILFRDDLYDGQFARTLAASYSGMADLGEAFATAHAIGKPSPDRWYEGWQQRAGAIMISLDATDEVASVRSLALRATEYFRQAFFFLRHDLTDSRLRAAYRSHVTAFAKAMPLLAPHVEEIPNPCYGTTLKAFLFSADADPVPRSTILFPCGYDSTAEEGWNNAASALARGYNAVTFEGPGQGGALYEQGLFFHPDFDTTLTPLIDCLERNPRVDNDAIVLIGRSFAGYLAPQAATVEHRIAALVCDPAQPDMGAHLPTGVVGRVAAPVVETEMRFSPDRQEFFGARMAAHGVESVGEYFAELRRYTMLDKASEIRCPTLLIECEGDPIGGGGASLASVMGDCATVKTLTIADGAGGHCAWLGQRVWDDVVYGWLGETLASAG